MSEDGRRPPDLEEDGAALDEDGSRTIEFWEDKQRDVVLSVVDYNLGTLSELVREGTIDVAPRYQRRERWDRQRQSLLIESFLMNVPVPPIFLNEDQYGAYSVIDGKQRLLAIAEFFSGNLQLTGLNVFHEANGQTLDTMDAQLRSILRTRPTIRTIIILRQSDSDIKFEVFGRLNTGGVNLNAQEIRNSTYPGPLNDLILELSENEQFHRLLGIDLEAKEGSYIYTQMRDAEFVLRFLVFRDRWEDYSGGMKHELDGFMSENQRMSQEQIDQAREDFLRTIEVVEAAFGQYAFQRYNPDTEQWRNQVLAAALDAQMIGSFGLDADDCREHRLELIAGMKELFADPGFREAVDSATNTASRFHTRIRMVRQMVQSVLEG